MPHKDPEIRSQYMREYARRTYQRDKAKRYQRTLNWRKKNPVKFAAIAKRYAANNEDRLRERMRRIDAQPHRVQKRLEYWDSLDLETQRRYERAGALNRKLKVATNGGTSTKPQWYARAALYGWQCAYCPQALSPTTVEIDHVIPVSKGGQGWPSNLVPACRSCNARKHTRRWSPRLPRPKGVLP